MEDSTTSFSILYSILNWSMLGGGSIAAVCVWRWHGRNPPDRAACTAALVARAWSHTHLAILLSAFLFLYLVAAGSAGLFQDEHLPTARLAIVTLIYALLIAVIGILNRKRSVSWTEGFGMGPGQLRLLRLSPLLYLAVIPFLMIITKGYHWMLFHWFGLEPTLQDVAQTVSQERSWLAAGYILSAIFTGPIYEELIFRGILFPFIARQLGVAGGVAVTSAVFGLIHFHIPSFLPMVLLSAVLCLAYWRTGSLWVSIGIHAVFNAIGILAIKLLY